MLMVISQTLPLTCWPSKDTECVDMVPIRCDNDGCFVIKRLQGQGCDSVPVDEVGEGHGVNTPMDQT